MIIKNNFNTRRDNLVGNDYQSIGATRTNSLLNEKDLSNQEIDFTDDKNTLVNQEENEENNEEENDNNKWDFFR